jgi:hypothetical protein
MPELTALSEEARQRAMERFELLRPHLEQGRELTRVGREAGCPIARPFPGWPFTDSSAWHRRTRRRNAFGRLGRFHIGWALK